jgi:hypothetical protein
MRTKLLILFGVAASVWGQPTELRVDGVTATQALLSYKTPNDNPCSVEVSESVDFTPLADDVNGTLFTGANSDSGRAAVSAVRRVIIVGTRKASLASDGKMHSRALKADTQYFGRISCGSPATVQFVTAQIQGIAPEALPYDPNAFGNLGVPEFDVTDKSKPVVDPQTGAKLYSVTGPKDFSHVGTYNFASGVYFGGAGWSNPGNITAASSGTLARSPAGTAPIFIPMKTGDAGIWGGFTPYDNEGSLTDAALNVYGSGSDGSSTNRQINVCLSVDSGQTCYTNNVTITLPSSAGSVGTFPSTFPSYGAENPTWSPFVGWGKIIPRNYMASGMTVHDNTYGSAVAGVFTVRFAGSQHAARSMLNLFWAPGSKVYVAGSAPTCASNFCTLAHVDKRDQMTFVENLTISNADWYFAGVGFLISKTNSTGTVSISANYKIAKSFAIEAGAQLGCSRATVTTNVDRHGNPISPGIVGRICLFNVLRAGPGALYFVGETVPEFRLLSLGRLPDSPSPGTSSDDWLYAPALRLPGTPTIIDTNNPNLFYIGVQTNNGLNAIFKGTYTGDYREVPGLFFTATIDGGVVGYVDDHITWENVTPSSTGQDLRSRVLASNTPYDERKYGGLYGLQFAGITNNHAVFIRLYGAQDSACWVFVFNSTTGAYVSSWNTVTGGGAAGARYGGCHAVGVGIDKIVISNNGLSLFNSTQFYGGPFTAVPTHVFRSGSPSTDTRLPYIWDGSYDGACPSDIDQVWKDKGAVGNRCVTLRFATEPCSGYATSAELANTPCPGDPTKSYIGSPAAPGDEIFDSAQNNWGCTSCPPPQWDSEHMLMVKRLNTGVPFDAVFMRDAGDSYCCMVSQSSTPGNCAGADFQAVHSATGWTAFFSPLGSCHGLNQFIDPDDQTDVKFEKRVYIGGHSAYESPDTTHFNFAAVGGPGYAMRYNAPFTSLGKFDAFGVADYQTVFADTTAIPGVVQSYVSPGLAGIGLDWRHINSNSGFDIEVPFQRHGPLMTAALVSGQSHTWKISGFWGTSYPKEQGFEIWTGVYVFGDMSSATTGDRISDATPFKYCYVYRANECRTGSSPGDLYVSTSGMEVDQCFASQVAVNALCVFPMAPVHSQLVQMDTSKADSTNARIRRLGINNTSPGAQYVYSHNRPFSVTQPFKSFATGYHQSGVWTGSLMIDPGKWSESSTSANDFVKIPVTIGAIAGANQVRVRFGYSDTGATGASFYCTSRAEDCLTDTASVPFAFEGDTLTPAACTNGCTINVPAIQGRILKYRVERLNSGTLVSVDPVQWQAVP